MSKRLPDVKWVFSKDKWTILKASNHLRVEKVHQYFHLLQFIQSGSRPVLCCWTHSSLRSSALPKGSRVAVDWVREYVLIDTEQEICRFNTRKAKRAGRLTAALNFTSEVFQLSKRHLCDFLENPPTSVDLHCDLLVRNLHLYKLKLEPLY